MWTQGNHSNDAKVISSQVGQPLTSCHRTQVIVCDGSGSTIVRRMGSSLRGRTVWTHRHTGRGPCSDSYGTQDCLLTWTCPEGSQLLPGEGQKELSQDLGTQTLWSLPESTQPFNVKTKHGHICDLKNGGSIFINLRRIGCIRKDKCFGLTLILLLFMKGGHRAYNSRHCGP